MSDALEKVRYLKILLASLLHYVGLYKNVIVYVISCVTSLYTYACTIIAEERVWFFLRATAVPAGTVVARISYGNSVRLSVCLSVTTRYGFKARRDRDCGFSPHDSLESLVSCEVILVPLGEEIPFERGHQKGVPNLEIVILPLLAYLA